VTLGCTCLVSLLGLGEVLLLALTSLEQLLGYHHHGCLGWREVWVFWVLLVQVLVQVVVWVWAKKVLIDLFFVVAVGCFGSSLLLLGLQQLLRMS